MAPKRKGTCAISAWLALSQPRVMHQSSAKKTTGTAFTYRYQPKPHASHAYKRNRVDLKLDLRLPKSLIYKGSRGTKGLPGETLGGYRG